MKRNLGENEKEFGSAIEDLFKLFGWEFYHVVEQYQYARRTSKGFPDYVAIRSPRLIFAELKTDKRKSKLTVEQARWLWELRKTRGLEVYIWRPRMLDKIVEILR